MRDKIISISGSNTDVKYTEHALLVDSFNKPAVYYNNDAIGIKIIELLLMNPGTYPTKPYMGLGLVANYRYTFFDDLPSLQTAITEQIETYLPEFAPVMVNLQKNEEKKTLGIFISIMGGSTGFNLLLDEDSRSLTFAKN